MNLFERQVLNFSEVFKLIAQAKTGQKLLESYIKAADGNRIIIAPYPTEVRLKLYQANNPKTVFSCNSTPIGGVFTTDGKEGTIYLDFQGELGILTTFLFHEMYHSLDQRLWEAAVRTNLTHTEKKKIIIQSEYDAYHAQHQFLEELKQVHPTLEEYFQAKYPHISFLNRKLDFNEVQQMYSEAI